MTRTKNKLTIRVAAALMAGILAAFCAPMASYAYSGISAGMVDVLNGGSAETVQSGWTTITNVTETNPDSGDYHKSYGWRIVSTVTIEDGLVTDVVVTGKGIAMPAVPEMEMPYFEPCHYYMEERIIDAKIDATNPASVDSIDVVSGATQTSHWIKEATKEALVKWNDQKIENASIKLAKTSLTYTGKALAPAVTVKSKSGKMLINGTDYTVAYKNNKNAGKATVTVTGKGVYNGAKSATFTIAKAKQTIKAAKTYTLKAKNVKKKAQKLSVKFKASGNGKVTYTAAKTAGGKVSIAKNGKVTVKKGTKKGTYTLKVKVTAAAKGNYAKTTVKNVKLVVKVK